MNSHDLQNPPATWGEVITARALLWPGLRLLSVIDGPRGRHRLDERFVAKKIVLDEFGKASWFRYSPPWRE